MEDLVMRLMIRGSWFSMLMLSVFFLQKKNGVEIINKKKGRDDGDCLDLVFFFVARGFDDVVRWIAGRKWDRFLARGGDPGGGDSFLLKRLL